MNAPTKRATRRLAASLAIATGLATGVANAETYYWDRGTAEFTTANGWASQAGGTATLVNADPSGDASAAAYLADDFVVKSGRAIISSGSSNDTDFWFNGNSLTLALHTGSGDKTRFYFRGRTLNNCKLVLCGDSAFYCWGRKASYESAVRPSSSIYVDSSATRATPASIPIKKDGGGCTRIDLECPISGNGALLITCVDDSSTKLPAVLEADNSGFTGSMKIHGSNASSLQVVTLGDASALGGDPAAFDQYGLELEFAKLSATVDASTTANRGLCVSQDSTIEVASGKTLAVPGAFAFADSSKTLTKSGAGTLVLSGGLQSGATCGTMKLNAGTLAFGDNTSILWSKLDPSAATSATLALNGGATLVADTGIAANANLSLTVDGGVIDTDGSAVTIAEDIGGNAVTFKGGNTVTLSGTVGYTGKTYVAAGTTLSVSGTDAATILGQGLVLSGVPALNTPYTVLTSDADLTGANLANVTCGISTSCTKEVVDGHSIVVTATGDVKQGFWTGAAGDGKVSSAGNWSDGVPSAGAALDFSGVPSGSTIIGDTDLTYGAVTIGGNITFRGTFAATSFSDTLNISVAANSTVTLDGDLRFSHTVARYILNTIDAGGRFVVTGDIELTSSATKELKPFNGSGALVAKGLVSNGRNGSGTGTENIYLFRFTRPSSSTLNWIVGANGISGSQRFYCFSGNGYTTTANIQPDDSDFTVTTTIGVAGTLNLNTTGYDGNPHKITFSGNGSINQAGTVNITGNGTVELANNINGGLKVNVKDTATLSVKCGKSPGNANSSTMVESGATLEIAESAETLGEASVTPSGNLTLNDGAKLKFNFTSRKIAPVIACASGKTVTVGSTVYVQVSTGAGIDRPCGGEYILTSDIDFTGKTVALADGNPSWVLGVSVDDSGNIVVNVKPDGLMVIVR